MSSDRCPEPPPDHAPPLHAVRPAVPPHPDDAAGFARVLRRRDFRYLWAAQCGSQLAQNFIQFALLVVVYDLTGLTTAVAAVAVAFTFPGVLLSAPAGVYADRHDKRSLMMLTNLLRAGLLVLIPLSQLAPFLQHQAWPLLVITFLFSSVGQVFAPAEAASIPSLVSREQIQGAMSLFMTTVIFTLMLGSVLAPGLPHPLRRPRPLLHRRPGSSRWPRSPAGGSARRCGRWRRGPAPRPTSSRSSRTASASSAGAPGCAGG